MTMGGHSETMRTEPVSLLARGGAVAVIAAIVFALSALAFQCLYWLRFGLWFDWTDPHGPRFPGQGWSVGPWKGLQAIFDLIVTAPVQLFASITGLILVVLYVWVRSLKRRY